MSDQLAPYRRKRDFARTPEPAGTVEPGSPIGRRFVVQRHRARNLHYDLRLEVDGVLVSWAVPKGPTLDPGVRRAAFHVEDHPLEYYDFEGVIPSGEYGGGDVIVWDAGTWEPYKTADPGRALAEGELHFDVTGEKLRGRFVIVRTSREGRDEWLLLHKRDEYATPGWDPEEHPRSVLSGRTNDEVKADPDRMWRSDLPAQRANIPLKSTWDVLRADELDALSDRWSIFGRELRMTNLDKVLFQPRPGEEPVRKRDFLRYAAAMAPTLVPYLAQRALNLPRALPSNAPAWLPRWDGPDRTYVVVDEPAALVWAANFGALEWRAWISKIDQPDQPTYAVIDLEPKDGTQWTEVLTLARLYRAAFEHLDLVARPKVTGAGGLEIWVPIARGPDVEVTRRWVEQLSTMVGAVVPELAGRKWQVDERGPLAPYSPRPAPGAPVSAPIDWDELDDPGLRPDGFTIRTIGDRLATKGDLFREVLANDQHLPRIS